MVPFTFAALTFEDALATGSMVGVVGSVYCAFQNTIKFWDERLTRDQINARMEAGATGGPANLFPRGLQESASLWSGGAVGLGAQRGTDEQIGKKLTLRVT